MLSGTALAARQPGGGRQDARAASQAARAHALGEQPWPMRDLSLHLLDLLQNSLAAGARLISVALEEDPPQGMFCLQVRDDGQGLGPGQAARALDPFFSGRGPGQVGLGLSLLRALMRRCGGDLTLESPGPGQGALVRAWCAWNHPDRPPLGPWGVSLWDLIAAHPGVVFRYQHRLGAESLELDTRELRAQLGPLQSPGLALALGRRTQEALEALGAGRLPVIKPA